MVTRAPSSDDNLSACLSHDVIYVLKILLDVFHIQYIDIEATILAWKAKTKLKNVVSGDLAPHQMFRFFHEFGITETTSWSDLSYDRAEIITHDEKGEHAGHDDLLAPISESNSAPKVTIASISRPNNRKRSS